MFIHSEDLKFKLVYKQKKQHIASGKHSSFGELIHCLILDKLHLDGYFFSIRRFLYCIKMF